MPYPQSSEQEFAVLSVLFDSTERWVFKGVHSKSLVVCQLQGQLLSSKWNNFDFFLVPFSQQVPRVGVLDRVRLLHAQVELPDGVRVFRDGFPGTHVVLRQPDNVAAHLHEG